MTPAILKTLPTAQMIEIFIMTGKLDKPEIPTVRGWIMDELESRNPEAFDKWLDSENCEDEELVKYFN